MQIRRILAEHRDVAVFVLLAVSWFLVRHFLKAALCSGPCWLEPSDWPDLLGLTPDTPRWQIGLLLFFLFAWPTGWTSVLATVIGIQLGFAHHFSVLDLTVLFVAATAASNIATFLFMQKILDKPGRTRKAWLARVKKVQARLGVLGRQGSFWLLAAGNALSSQLYMAALAVSTKTPTATAFGALMLGSLASFLVPLFVLFSAKVMTLDGVTAALLVLALFAVGGHALSGKNRP
ncbi:MAG: hypothetical protein Q8P02_03545, partial [Candidatus Micrarchaeota archaeon]|nr:hypothetical protein [Candidatus Micrarchaeota archaeon]